MKLRITDVVVLITLFLFIQINGIFSAKILVLVPITTGSESNFYGPIVEELAGKNHDITLVTSKKSKSYPTKIIQIEPMSSKEMFAGFENPFLMAEQGEDTSFALLDMDFFTNLCIKVYENIEFEQKVLNNNVKFDIIITSAIYHQCFYGLAVKNNASIILFSTFSPPNYSIRNLGTHFPTSYLPYPTLPYSTNMNIFQKTYNLFIDLLLEFYNEFSYVHENEKIYKKYIVGSENYPGVKEIMQKHVSLIIMNNYHGVTYHRPLLPDVIEVGGIHCKKGGVLPPDLEKFVGKSNAPEGFIYFSLGSNVQGKHLPPKLREIFVKSFSKLKQKVLWKWEGEGEFPEGLPPNVKVSKWFPQKEILDHPNLKFFITHGGMFSIYESIYYGVPIIVMPVFFDQNANALLAVRQGFAIQLDIYNLKQEELDSAIDEILKNKTFKEKATSMSNIFKDQKETPLERAMYWIEYVIRHNGAPHLRSAARELSWLQFHSLDVILGVGTILGITILIFISIIKFLGRKLFSKSTPKEISTNTKKSNKKNK